MNASTLSRRQIAIFAGISSAIHVALLFCVPVGESREPVGRRVVREFKAEGIEFIKKIQPKPKPTVVQKPRVKRVVHHSPRRIRRIVRQRPRRSLPKPAERPSLEARVMPPPEPKDLATPPLETEVAETPETPPEPKPTPVKPIDTSQMVAMAPQPVATEPNTTPTSPQELTPRLAITDLPPAPRTPDIGNPEVTPPAPASGGEPKRQPQIGLNIGGQEDRSALPGTEHRVGAPEHIAGPGGPLPVTVSPNPGGAASSPRLAALPTATRPLGPPMQRGGRELSDRPSSVHEAGTMPGKRSPAPPGPNIGPTMGISPPKKPIAGTGDNSSPAGRGSPVAVLTSPKGVFSVPPQGASGQNTAGTGGGGGNEIVFGGGGLEEFLAEGPTGGGGDLARGSGKSSPALGSPWGGKTSVYARRGGGEGEGDGQGRGKGPGGGSGSGLGEPVVVAMAGPGGGYGQGDSSLPLGFPDGTARGGPAGFPWLEPGLGRMGGGGEGLFGGPHGYGSGGVYPGVGDKATPGGGGIPEEIGLDIPAPHRPDTGGEEGESGEGPVGPGGYGPLAIGESPVRTGLGEGSGLFGLAKRGFGLPLLPESIVRPLFGIHTGDIPNAVGEGSGAAAKQGPQGLYADLVGTFDIPVGVTNSDYNTDEVSVLNLLNTMRERTSVRVKIQDRYVPLEYEAIKDAPMLWISGHKPFTWTPREREALKKYVENGGTILAEDCHGPFNQVFPEEVRRIFGKELEPIPLDDELFRSFYVMNELPAGDVQERLPIRGLRMPDGRLGVIYSPNDYSDAWKVPRGAYVPNPTKEQAYRMGINMYIYILAHWRRGQAQSAAKPPTGP
ncbi:MAG: DUF4159 domain-containing protein [Candidatus Zipacnadales bacterium]